MKKIKKLELSPLQKMSREEQQKVMAGDYVVLLSHKNPCNCTQVNDTDRETWVYRQIHEVLKFNGTSFDRVTTHFDYEQYRINTCIYINLLPRQVLHREGTIYDSMFYYPSII